MKNFLKITTLIAATLLTIWGVTNIWRGGHLANTASESEEQEEAGRRAKTIAGRYEQEFLMTRDLATNTIPRERLLAAYRIAQERRAQMVQADQAIPVYWNERGPNNVAGRTRALIFDANDATGHTVWAAGVAGGLWRTANIESAAPSWALVNDFFENLAITTIVQDPSNANILYFGTGGEGTPFVGGNGIGNADRVQGLGIWRSLDAGASWQHLGIPDPAFLNVAKMVVTANGRVFAATRSGVWRSANNGDDWTIEPSPANTGLVQDLEIAGNGDVFAAVNGSGILRLQNGAWGQVTAGLPTGFSRIELACAATSNRVYALFENSATQSCLGIFTTADGSTNNNWTACVNPNVLPTATPPATSNFASTQAWYDLAVAVDPNDENRVFIGGLELLVSGDAGATWTQISQWYGSGFQFVHADHHAIVFRPGNSNEMLFGNDGGVWYATNGSAATPTIQQRNSGYNVTQFFSVALSPVAGSNYMFGGTQDNGTPRFNAPGISSTVDISGGDGGYCFIDQDNANIQITSYIRRQFDLSTDGGANFTANFIGNNTNALFITPAEYDDAANVLYVSDANNSLGRTVDVGGANTFTTEAIAAFGNGRATALTVSPNTANRLFVGTETGRIVRIDNANQPGLNSNMPAPVAISAPALLGRWISSIAVEPGNDNHLLVTCANYGAQHVLETTDGGTTWTNLTALAPSLGGLPDMPVRWVMFNPFNHDQVLLATELGVWSTDDLDGVNTEWWPTSTFGLANVRVDMLQYRSSDHLVAAATHGRGMYTTDYFTLLNTCTPNLNKVGNIPSGLYMAEDFITSTGVVTAGGKVIMQAGDYVELKPGFWSKQGSDFWALIRACNISPAAAAPFAGNLVEKPTSESTGRSQSAALPQGQLALNCFPNPTTYQLFVEANLPAAGTYSLFVRNIQGQMIERFAANNWRDAGAFQVELNAANYAPGVYVLTLQTTNNTVTKRFVVAR